MTTVYTYRISATGVWQYGFYENQRQIGRVSSLVGPNATTRIEAESLSWYSRFDMDITVIPGISRRVKANPTGEEVYRLIYWKPGYYEFVADQPQGKWTMFAEHRNGRYLFGEQGQPVTAMTERIDSAEWMPVSSLTVEPYFRTTFYEEVSLPLKMLVLSFPAMRFY